MRFNGIAAAILAGAVAAPSALAVDEWTIHATGTFDFLFNGFPPPNYDFVGVGDTWELYLGYDADMPADMSSGSFASFKSSLCVLTLIINDSQSNKSVQFNIDDFAGGDCDLITTTNACACGDDNTVDVVVSNAAGVGLNLNILDEMGNTLPLFALPTLNNVDPVAFAALGASTQLEFFMPTSGSTARAVSVTASLELLQGCIMPTPGTGALLGVAGLVAVRRRR
ncbi:MAG: hypothetical protein R3B49_11875 [Phycisphaerales bacterium]